MSLLLFLFLFFSSEGFYFLFWKSNYKKTGASGFLMAKAPAQGPGREEVAVVAGDAHQALWFMNGLRDDLKQHIAAAGSAALSLTGLEAHLSTIEASAGASSSQLAAMFEPALDAMVQQQRQRQFGFRPPPVPGICRRCGGRWIKGFVCCKKGGRYSGVSLVVLGGVKVKAA